MVAYVGVDAALVSSSLFCSVHHERSWDEDALPTFPGHDEDETGEEAFQYGGGCDPYGFGEGLGVRDGIPFKGTGEDLALPQQAGVQRRETPGTHPTPSLDWGHTEHLLRIWS